MLEGLAGVANQGTKRLSGWLKQLPQVRGGSEGKTWVIRRQSGIDSIDASNVDKGKIVYLGFEGMKEPTPERIEKIKQIIIDCPNIKKLSFKGTEISDLAFLDSIIKTGNALQQLKFLCVANTGIERLSGDVLTLPNLDTVDALGSQLILKNISYSGETPRNFKIEARYNPSCESYSAVQETAELRGRVSNRGNPGTLATIAAAMIEKHVTPRFAPEQQIFGGVEGKTWVITNRGGLEKIEEFSSMDKVESLSFKDVDLSAEGRLDRLVNIINQCPNLKSLSFEGTQISDLSHLNDVIKKGGLQSLTDLNLADTKVALLSDQVLSLLNLKKLNVMGTPLLGKIPDLKTSLKGTKLTEVAMPGMYSASTHSANFDNTEGTSLELSRQFKYLNLLIVKQGKFSPVRDSSSLSFESKQQLQKVVLGLCALGMIRMLYNRMRSKAPVK